jgi:hypothetical protein
MWWGSLQLQSLCQSEIPEYALGIWAFVTIFAIFSQPFGDREYNGHAGQIFGHFGMPGHQDAGHGHGPTLSMTKTSYVTDSIVYICCYFIVL